MKRRGKKGSSELELPLDPYESARVAGLRYISGEGPGIVRKKTGRGFSYVGPDGKPVQDEDEVRRIEALAIPPAWTSVWICPFKTGHIQAVGRDAKGRKQYRYHELYRQVRDTTKFHRMIAFASYLPKIRERVHTDLNRHNLSKEKILATVVRLLEKTAIRIGNEEYVKENDSYGLTTLLEDHVQISGPKIRFHFRGKSGQVHDIELSDRKLSKILYDCQCIPGHELFHYLDENGEPVKVYSEDVNEYLREITGEHFTAKDFRTWVGTSHAALELDRIGAFTSETEAKKNVVAAIKAASAKLGNRPATCRAYYVHPAILDAYMDATLFDAMKSAKPGDGPHALRIEEVCVVGLLEKYKPQIAIGKAAA